MAKPDKTREGFENPNRQNVVRRADTPVTDDKMFVYVMRCGDCGAQYGARAREIGGRKCPKCQGGKPGLEF